jgi:biopolymer transport protein ExbD
MPRGKRGTPEVNASSMADIAFLLLVFFLVTTTIATDRGMPMLLPPKKDDTTPPMDVNQRNVYLVIVNFQNNLLVEGDEMGVGSLKEGVKRFLTNNGQDPNLSDSPQKAIVSLKADRGTDYATYIMVLDQIKAAYHELRAEELGITLQAYLDLDTRRSPRDKQLYDQAKDKWPMQISEAEPTRIGE